MLPTELPGNDCVEFLTTHLYYVDACPGLQLEPGNRAACYGISMRNVSETPIRIIARKWMFVSSDGRTEIVEGDCLFGMRPLLMPGQIYAVNGCHAVKPPARISLTLIGRGNDGHIFQTPSYKLHRTIKL